MTPDAALHHVPETHVPPPLLAAGNSDGSWRMSRRVAREPSEPTRPAVGDERPRESGGRRRADPPWRDDAPRDATRLYLPIKEAVGITIGIVAMIAAFYAATGSIRADSAFMRQEMTRLSDRMDYNTRLAESQYKLQEERAAFAAKLQDERSQALTAQIRATDAKAELLRIELATVKEMVLKLQPR